MKILQLITSCLSGILQTLFHGHLYFALPDPRKPSNMWPGTDPDIGSKFLKFNRKLVRDFEYWRDKNKFNKLLSWNPVTRIPGKLTYSKRINDYPKFLVEPWLTKSGSKNKEPATLSRKLSDFSNVNQLGIVIYSGGIMQFMNHFGDTCPLVGMFSGIPFSGNLANLQIIF